MLYFSQQQNSLLDIIMFAHEKVLLLKELRMRRIKVEISNVRLHRTKDKRRTFEGRVVFYLHFDRNDEEEE